MKRLAWCGLAIAVVACREGPGAGSFAVRDSGGIQIVSNPATVRGDSGCVAVDSVPMLTIGGADAEGPFDLLRATGALRLPDGGVVVLNGGTQELRVFDSAGRHTRTLGRKGSGPGEFQSPSGLLWYGADTLMVADYGTSRITLLGTDGRLIEAIGVRGLLGGALVGRLADGSFVFIAGGTSSRDAQPGLRRDPMRLVRVSRSGAVLDTLGSSPGSDVFVERDGERVMMSVAPFGHYTSVAMANGVVYVADNAEYRVRVFAEGRFLERIVERAHEPVTLAQAEVEREKARRLGATTSPQFREMVERMYQPERLPEMLPVHGRIAVDADGRLWVRAYGDAPEGDVAWDVFDADGRLRCALSLPAAFAVREIGHDFLLGVLTDADGVEQVRLYGLRRRL